MSKESLWQKIKSTIKSDANDLVDETRKNVWKAIWSFFVRILFGVAVAGTVGGAAYYGGTAIYQSVIGGTSEKLERTISEIRANQDELRKSLSSVQDSVGKVTDGLDFLGGQLYQITNTVVGIKGSVSSIGKSVGDLTATTELLRGSLERIKSGLGELQATSGGLDEQIFELGKANEQLNSYIKTTGN